MYKVTIPAMFSFLVSMFCTTVGILLLFKGAAVLGMLNISLGIINFVIGAANCE